MSRTRNIHCGFCANLGHNVRQCQDPTALSIYNILMEQTDLNTAIEMCESMESRFAMFILAKNRVPVGTTSTRRNLLIQSIRSKFQHEALMRQPPTPIPVQQEPMPTPRSNDRNKLRIIRSLQLYLTSNNLYFNTTIPASLHQNPILPTVYAFHHITTSIARIILFSLYKYIAERTRTQTEFHRQVLWAIDDGTFIRNSIDADLMARANVYLPVICISYIANKATLAHYRLLETAATLRRTDMLQSIFPLVSNHVFEINGADIQAIPDDIDNDIDRPFIRMPDVMKPLTIKVLLTDDDDNYQIPPDSDCCVCLNDELSLDQFVLTGCKHVFCYECITGIAHSRGIKSFIRCPCCRDEIDSLYVPNNTVLHLVNHGLAPI